MLDLSRINNRLCEIRRRLRQLQQVAGQMNQTTNPPPKNPSGKTKNSLLFLPK